MLQGERDAPGGQPLSSANTLSDGEVSLILGMLKLSPRPTNQAILSYFSVPGRDINHRVIAEIENGQTRAGVASASAAEVRAFMAAAVQAPRLNADSFITTAGTGLRVLLDWWPVGQGLFASGALVGQAGEVTNWVYDCGTTSSDSLLEEALTNFAAQQADIEATAIRLCALSHFDRDHISGVVRLIDRFPVRTLLLPYIPLWRRVLIAVEQGIGPDDPLLEFFLDPVAYLGDGRDGRIGEIVFVPPSGPDGPVPEAPEDPDGSLDGRAPNLKVESEEPPEEALGDPAAATHAGVAVQFLRRAGRLWLPLLWEFVPYNDAGLAPSATPAFIGDAAPLIATLLNSPTGRASALKDLRQLYDDHFGDTSERRNLISLFLYSGPLGNHRLRRRFRWSWRWGPWLDPERSSQIHTGDGTLDAGRRYEEFARFFSAGGRLARTALFQVMHHGSRANWHSGLAAKIAPDVSIFSSDPAHRRFGHPHAEVLRDFWRFGATSVDRHRRYHLQGWLAR